MEECTEKLSKRICPKSGASQDFIHSLDNGIECFYEIHRQHQTGRDSK